MKILLKKLLFSIVVVAATSCAAASAFAAAVSISCAANPTIVQGVDFQTTDDVTLTTSGTCTLTSDQTEGGANAYVSMASLTIDTGVTLTHALTGTTASHHNELDIHLTGDLIISGTGSINVAGKGYNGGGASGYGYTNGNVSNSSVSSYLYSGGSHGGRGGKYSTYVIGAAYDSIINPALPGGGGGGANATTGRGMHGGGVVIISATNITVNGSINANGETFSGSLAGGGAGGSINLTATGTLSGSGSITANGTYNSSSNLGGGAGGLIALYYDTNSSSFSSLLAAGANSTATNGDGAAGFIFKKATSDTNGVLILDANSNNSMYYDTAIDSATDQTFDSVTIKNKASLAINSTGTAFSTPTLDVQASSAFTSSLTSALTITTLTLASAATADFAGNVTTTNFTDSGGTSTFAGSLDTTTMSATGTVSVTGAMTVVTGYTSTGATTTVTGTLTMPAFFSGTPTGTLTTNGAAYIAAGTVTIPNGMTWNANSTVQTSSGVNLTAMTIQSGGVLSHTVAGTTASTYNQLNFMINGTLTIDSGGSINVSGKGYNGGGASGYGYTNGNLSNSSVSSYLYSGGSHGGRGGKYSTHTVAAAYDSIINPVLPGGGGGGNNATTQRGMNGGGVVIITATNIAVNGSINANGETFSGSLAGGGAGGSINLIATDTLSGTGSITANGTYNSTSNLGGGGGGLIALYYDTNSSSLSSLLAAGANSTATNGDGAAGFIFKKATSDTNGVLILDGNSNNSMNYDTAIDSATDQTFDSVTIKNKASLAINSTGTAFSTPTLDVQASSAFSSSASSAMTITTLTTGSAATADFTGDVTATNFTDSGGTSTFAGSLDTTTMSATGTVSVTGAMTVVTGYTSTGATTTVTGTLTMPAFFSGTPTGTLTTNGAAYIAAGTVTIPNGMTWNANSTVQTSSGVNLTEMTIQSGGVLGHTVASTTAATYNQLNFTINGTLTIDSGGSINVSGKGYNGGGSSGYGYTNGNLSNSSVSSYLYSGGSHGGRGGKYSTYAVAAAYDSIINPVLPGGGGGGNNATTQRGMNGGGVIIINATNIAVGGTINANGETFSGSLAGGGAGGSINLTASDTISGAGAISADGTVNTTSNLGGGGGGRIAISCATCSYTSSVHAYGGNPNRASGDGAAGTVFKKTTSNVFGDLIINNNDAVQAYYTTSLLSTVPTSDQIQNSGYAFNSLTFSNAGILNIPVEMDSVSDGSTNVSRKFFCASCPTNNDTLSDGEIVYVKDLYAASGITTANYTCVSPTTPSVQWSAASQSSLDESGTLTVTATLSASSGQDVTVPYTVSGTATGGGTDYTITASPIVITAGSTTANATITIASDTLDEPDETVIVTMGTPLNATAGTTSVHTATITDDDATPSVQWTAASQSSASESGTMTVTAQLSAASGQNVTVPYTVTGTATGDGTDYSITASPITITAGGTTATATITIVGDTTDESDETVILTIGSPTNATNGATDVHTATITDDDNGTPSITLSKSAATLAEDGSSVTLTATADTTYTSDITVNLSYSGTATNTSDYTGATSITILAGATTGTATLTSALDTLDEADETIITDISSVTNGTETGTQQQTVTITDNDTAPSVQWTASSQSSVGESSTLTLTAELSAASGQDVTVPYTLTGTATGGGTDYSITASPITITAGSTTTTATITIAADTLDEANETVIATIGSPTNATAGTTSVHTATITDDDATPSVQWTAASQSSVGESSTLTLTAELSAASGLDVTVPYTMTGTAADPADYGITASPITITAGATTGTATITIAADIVDEANETVIATIGSPTNATAGTTSVHTATITDDDATPSVQWTAASQSSVGESSTLTLTAELSAASSLDVTVPYTMTGTATDPADYGITASPITILAGATTGTATITIATDVLDEANETVIATIGSPTNASAGTTSVHTATITDDDAAPSVQWTAASQSSVGESSTLTLTAELSAASGQDVTVPYTLTGTATDPADYGITASPITILAGATTGTATITIAADTLDEANETVIATIGSPSNATAGTTSVHTATITDDDATPSVQWTAASQSSVGESSTLTLTAELSAASGQDVTVPYTLTGTATDPADYGITASPITILAGATTGTATITIAADTLDETNETVIATIGSPTNATAGTTSVHTATITDDDATPSLSIDDPTVAEDGTNETFTVTLSAASEQIITVDYATSDGSATGAADEDYTATSGTLTFTAGQTSKTIDVPVTNDTLDEASETITMTLSSVSATATISDAIGTGTITDNDAAPSVQWTAASQSSVGESSTLTLTAELSAASGQDVTVPYTLTGTATDPADYGITASPITILAGATTGTATITIAADTLDEANETVIATIGSPTNASAGTTSVHTATITDDDATPSVTFTTSSQSVSESGIAVTITAQLSAVSGQDVTLPYTVTGTATDTTDYSITASPITISAGSTTQTITVTPATDIVDEASETVIVTMGSPTNASQGATTEHTVTLTDDDTAPTVQWTASSQSSVGESSTLTLTAELSAASGQDVTVPYTLTGTATGGGTDYSITASPITITAGSTTTTATITIAADTLDEANETVIATIGSPTNATAGTTSVHTATITDDDATPSVQWTAASQSSVGESSTLTLTAELSAASGLDVTVPYTMTGTAADPADYGITASPITILAGATTGTATITIAADTLDEANETVIATIGSPSNASAGTTSVHTATITDDDTAPTLSIDDVTVTEGNSGSTNATFTVTLSATSGQALSVNYATSDATATASTDYTNTSGTLNFAAGETSKTFDVAVLGDVLDEANETYTVTLSAASNATISDATGTGTITDDDATPSVTFTTSSQSVSESGIAVTITAELSAASGQLVTIPYTMSGTATGGGTDYSITASPITITAGSTTQTITVTPVTDILDEPSETVIVTMGSPSNASQGATTAHTVTLTDDDATPSLSIDDVTVTEGTSAVFTVTLSAASGQTVTVDYATANGTATAGSDYTAASGSGVSALSFAAGETTKTISITTADDTLDEAAETYTIGLSNASNASISDASGAGNLNDNDTAPSVTFTTASQSVSEGGSAITITAELSASSGQLVTLPYTITGTATGGGTDYSITASPVTITAGTTTTTITITPVDDALDEASETVIVTMDSPTNATAGTTTVHTATLTDNDPAPSLSIDDTTVTEGSAANFTVTLSAASGQTVTVDYTTVADSATSNTDYTATSGTLTFSSSQTTKTISVATADDTTDEAAETYHITLSNTSATATISDATGAGTLNDNDAAPSVQWTASSQSSVGESSTLTLTAQLSAASEQSVTVPYTITGTATDPADYGITASPITILAGATTGTATITIATDALDEVDETVIATIGSPTNASAGTTSVHTATITDDDDAPTVTLTRNNATVAEAAGTSTLTATLSAVSGQDVTVNLAYSGTATNTSDYTRGGAGTSITVTAGATTGTLVLTAVQDTLDEAAETIITDISSVTNGTEATPQQVTVNITDDDAAPSVTLSVDTSDIGEADGTATVTATLSTTSGLPATINLAFSGVAVVNTDYIASNAAISVAAGATTGSITITPIDNSTRNGNKAFTVALDSATNATEAVAQELSLNLIDDEADLVITESGGTSTITEGGGTDSFTVALATLPADTVTVTLSGGSDANLSTTTLVFTTGNWDQAQTVTVTAIDDDIAEGAHTASISFAFASTDPDYAALVEPDLEVAVTDNDSSGISVTQSGGASAVTEGGATDTIDYVLTSEPTNNVTINFTSNAQLSLSAASLTFTSANWDEAQTLVVTAANDGVAEGAHTANITASASSSDSNYNGTVLAAISTSITDNDSAAVSITVSGGTTILTEADEAATDSFTVVLTSQPTANVTITIASEASVELSSSTLTFTAANWDDAQEVTVSAVDNFVDEGDHDSTINFTTASGDSNYNNLVLAGIVANITDNDTAGSSLSESGGTTAVTLSASDSYTIALDTEPTEDVTIDLTVGAGITAAPSSLTFTAEDWNEAQTITVSLDVANLPDGSTEVEITHQVTSDDSLYDAFGLAGVTVSVDTTTPPDDGDDSDDGDDDGDDTGAGDDDTDEEPSSISCPVKQCIAGGSSCTVSATDCDGYMSDNSCSYSWQQDSGTAISFTDSASTSLSLDVPADYDGTLVLHLTASCDSGTSDYLFTVQTIRKTIRSALLDASWIDGRVIAADSEKIALEQDTSDDEGDRLSLTINDQLTFLSASTEDLQAIYLPSADSRYLILADPSYSNHKGIILSIDVDTVAAQTSEIDVLDPDLATMDGIVVLEGPRSQAQLGYRIALAHLGETDYVAALLPGSNFGTLYFLNQENLEIEHIVQGTEALFLQTALMVFPDFDADDYSDSVLGILNAADASEDVSVATEAYDFKTIMGSDLFASATDLDEASENYNINFSDSSSVSLAASSDINQDGYDDVVMCAASDCTCSIFFGSASITDTQDLQADKTITCDESSAATAIAVGDYSGDDIDDIALLFGDSDNLYVLLGSANNDEIGFENSIEIITPSDDDLTDCLVTARKPEATADGLYVCGAPDRSLRIDFGDSLITNTSAAGASDGSGCSLHHTKRSSTSSALTYVCVLSSWVLLQRARKRKKAAH